MAKSRKQLPKSPTGIQGLDEITGGGLPRGRPTLVCGGAGCGKTLLAMEFLVRGARQFNEPGVFVTFEETAKELTQNVASLGFDLKGLIARKKVVLDFVYIDGCHQTEAVRRDIAAWWPLIRQGGVLRQDHAAGVPHLAEPRYDCDPLVGGQEDVQAEAVHADVGAPLE